MRYFHGHAGVPALGISAQGRDIVDKMPTDDGPTGNDGLTRRELLKRAGTVGAAAWAVPVVATFNAPAFAQADMSPNGACQPFECGDDIVVCGEGAPGTPFCGCCICDVDVEGNSFCWNESFCSDVPFCETSADCPEGWRCVTNCCGTVCFPPCGTLAAPPTGQLDRQDMRSGSGQR